MLYLVQHGEAVAKDTDTERPLTDRGAQDADNVGAFLAGAEVPVATIFHSGKLRAQQTADILAEHLTPERPPDEIEDIGATDPTDAIAAELSQWSHGIMLVSHMPFVSRLTGKLTTGDEHRPLAAFLPGSVAALEHTGDDHWVVSWLIRPELVRWSGTDRR